MMFAAGVLAGCSSRGVYEDIQQQEALKSQAPSGQPAPRRPAYDEYESERRKTGTAADIR